MVLRDRRADVRNISDVEALFSSLGYEGCGFEMLRMQRRQNNIALMNALRLKLFASF